MGNEEPSNIRVPIATCRREELLNIYLCPRRDGSSSTRYHLMSNGEVQTSNIARCVLILLVVSIARQSFLP